MQIKGIFPTLAVAWIFCVKMCELIGLGRTVSCCSRKEKLILLLAVQRAPGIAVAFFLPGSFGRFIGSYVK